MIFPESAVAHRYLDGLSGITIGEAKHNAFNIVGKCRNVDRYAEMDTVFKKAELELCGEAMPVDIVARGDDLPLPDESEGYVVSSHVLEHLYDPMGTMLEWLRVVRPGGFVLTIVPKRDALESDRGRPVTTIEELVARYSSPPPPDADEDIHWTVWSTELLRQVVQWIRLTFGTNIAIVRLLESDDKVGNGHLLLLHKRCDDDPLMADAETEGAPVVAAKAGAAPAKGSPHRAAKLALLDEIGRKKRTGEDIRGDVGRYIRSLGVRRVSRPYRVMVEMGEVDSGSWRVLAPFLELAKDPEFDVRISTHTEEHGHDFDWAHLVWLVRAPFDKLIPLIEKARASGRKFVYDLDDWLHGVPAFNPCQKQISAQQQPWLTENMMGAVDAVSLSTPYLAHMYQTMAHRVEVTPNSIDPDLWVPDGKSPYGEGERSTVNIGWAGTPTHEAELRMIVPVLSRIMAEHPHVWFVRAGFNGQDGIFDSLPRDRCIDLGWEAATHTLHKYLRLVDISIAPLVPCQFNLAKSNVKVLEASALGIPVVASAMEPYRECQEYAVLVQDNRPEGWMQALDTLIRKPDLRRSLGANAKEHVMQHCTVEANIGKWKTLIRELVDGEQEAQP